MDSPIPFNQLVARLAENSIPVARPDLGQAVDRLLDDIDERLCQGEVTPVERDVLRLVVLGISVRAA